jgi:uncharacterized membrane protein YgdD (TMEM256/DUF423 family)
MHKPFLSMGALAGAIAVALGAFGAHGLKKITTLTPETISAFQTGVQYQMYHTLALLATAILYERNAVKFIKWAGYCFVYGIILFSGSLYILTALKATETVGMNGIGMITPIGGLFFVAGWLLLFAGIVKKN